VRRDFVATLVCFGLSGVVSGSWFSRIPAARDHLQADLTVVGLVLLCLGLGSLLTLPVGGRLIRHFSSRVVCAAGGVLLVSALCLLPLVRSPLIFAALLLAGGAGVGCWQLALNVHGAAVERAAGRSVMPLLHGSWSGGVIIGSGIGALLAGAGVDLGRHFWMLLPVVLVANLIFALGWSDERAPVAGGERRARPSARVVTMPIMLLSVMIICSNIGEGTAADWLALYVHDERGLSQGLGAAAYTTYAVTSTLGRLFGGPVIDRLGKVGTLRLCGLVTCAAIMVTLFAPGPVGPYLGAALWGLGLAVVFPTVITIAGNRGGDNAAGAIAVVSTMGYAAFLGAPPLIGLLADHISLGFAIGGVMLLGLAITALAGPAARSSS
jgi:fucose permease